MIDAPVVPEVEPLGPQSLAWELLGDWRLFAMLGRGLMLQVGHPVVAAGVEQHSSYKTEPYARLERSLRSILGAVYDGPNAPAVAAAVRRMHTKITGVDGHGRQYHALDPEAFHWVHATIFESVHTMCLRFVRPLSDAESEQLYREFRQIGRLYGLRERDMPADLTAFWGYYEHMLRDRLEDNHVLREVLDQIHRPPAPPWLRLPGPLWSVVRWPPGRVQRLLTVGTLPPIARERWGLGWTAADELALDALGFALRTGARAVPFELRYQPRARRAWRRARRRSA